MFHYGNIVKRSLLCIPPKPLILSGFFFFLAGTLLAELTGKPLESCRNEGVGAMPILLVDDDRGTRITLSIALKEGGFDVDLAEDGPQALDRVRAVPYDWVISDVAMPGMSGIDLAREIKRLRPGCKIVIMSAREFRRNPNGVDIAGYFEKPVDVAGLCKLLRGK
jgi:CheY-like chemotaxis protein